MDIIYALQMFLVICVVIALVIMMLVIISTKEAEQEDELTYYDDANHHLPNLKVGESVIVGNQLIKRERFSFIITTVKDKQKGE